MENHDILDNDYLSEMELAVNGTVRNHLQTTAKWAKFLGIMGFIGTGFMVIGGLAMGAVGSQFGNALQIGSGLLAFIYIIVAGFYFLPSLFLYRFATSTQRSIQNNEQMDFEAAFHNLSRLYQFFGILTVVFLGIYVIIILVTIVGGSF